MNQAESVGGWVGGWGWGGLGGGTLQLPPQGFKPWGVRPWI